jgi:hypothetical protein
LDFAMHLVKHKHNHNTNLVQSYSTDR